MTADVQNWKPGNQTKKQTFILIAQSANTSQFTKFQDTALSVIKT